MTIFQRYILTTLGRAVSSAFVALLALLLVNALMRLTRLMVDARISLADMGSLLLFSLPQTATLALPIAALIGALMASSQLQGNSEMVVMMGSGMSRDRILRTVALGGLVLCLLALLNANWLAVASQRAQDRQLHAVLADLSYGALSPGSFTRLGQYQVFVERLDEQGMHGVFAQGAGQVLSAQRAILLRQPDPVIQLFNGSILPEDRTAGRLRFREFSLPLVPPEFRAMRPELSAGSLELLRSERASWNLRFHRRQAFATATGALTVLGFCLGSGSGRSGRGAAVLVGLAVILGFYVVRALALVMAEAGALPLIAGEWLAPLALLAPLWWFWMRFGRGG